MVKNMGEIKVEGNRRREKPQNKCMGLLKIIFEYVMKNKIMVWDKEERREKYE